MALRVVKDHDEDLHYMEGSYDCENNDHDMEGSYDCENNDHDSCNNEISQSDGCITVCRCEFDCHDEKLTRNEIVFLRKIMRATR